MIILAFYNDKFGSLYVLVVSIKYGINLPIFKFPFLFHADSLLNKKKNSYTLKILKSDEN